MSFLAPAPESAPPARPRPAATLAVVRDGAAGIEVLLLRRGQSNDQASGAWVFPGGIVDKRDPEFHHCCAGLDDVTASARLGLPSGGLDYLIAALRECFEESGLLYANGPDGQPLAMTGELARQLGQWRVPLNNHERSLGEMCREHGLTLAADRLVYFSHWLTPTGRPKRWDTRFFVAEAPAGQQATHDETEMVEQLWITPAEALARGDALPMMNPTRHTLEIFRRFDRVAALLDWARSLREIPRILPHIGAGRDGLRPVMPDEFAYAEVGRLDPQGRGHASYDLVPGRAVRLSPRIIRVTANNGSVMTGPGTNTYLVGGGERNEWAVIDPGPLDDAHFEAILAAAPGPIRWIFATHTHKDHSPAAAPLAARTGAPVYGLTARYPEWQDETFAPTHRLVGGERIALPGDTTLRAIHTPGHASNHLCYLLEEEKTLFTGDHVMQSATVVINPPDGDMAAYVASLRSLLDEDIEWLAPGHGFLMAQPRRAFEFIIAHRLKREAKVVDALRALGAPAPLETVLARVYDDVGPHLHAMATRSLQAHLFKLRDEGRAREAGGQWSLVG